MLAPEGPKGASKNQGCASGTPSPETKEPLSVADLRRLLQLITHRCLARLVFSD